MRRKYKGLQKDINELLDHLDGNATDELKSLCTSQKSVLTDHKAVCRSIKDTLHADYKTSTKIRNANHPRDIFIQNLKLSQTLAAYEIAIKEAKSETVLKEISFEKEPYLEDPCKTIRGPSRRKVDVSVADLVS